MSRTHRQLIWFTVLLAFTGCGQSGPELAPVSGRVTLDGNPVADADVMFQPEEKRSPSVGRTDKDGRYVIAYKRGVEGALVGKHTVRIMTVTEITQAPQLVPARYNTETELHKEVKSGENKIDFELTTVKK